MEKKNQFMFGITKTCLTLQSFRVDKNHSTAGRPQETLFD